MYAELLKEIWAAVYDPNTDIVNTIEKYFHPDYTQCINGITLDKKQYLTHVIEQKKQIKVLSFDYKHILEKKNELFGYYEVIGENTQHSPIVGEVIAYFCFYGKQVLQIHGQVRLLKGHYADVDMG